MKNKAELLVREDLDQKSKLLLEQARSVEVLEKDEVIERVSKLGYQSPKEQQRQKEQAERRKVIERTQKPLATALRKSGVKPFTDESVAKYKEAMLKRRFQLFTTEFQAASVILLSVGLITNILIFFNIGCWLASRGLISLETISLFTSIPILGLWLASLLAAILKNLMGRDTVARTLLTVGVYICFGSIPVLHEVFGPTRLEWRKAELKGYTQEIPREVLATIAEIHFHCPGATFEVEYLTRKPDPFVIASFESEQFYVEVWNEPNFHGKRLA